MYSYHGTCTRPDTSWRHQSRLPPCSLVMLSSRNLQFSHKGSLYQRKKCLGALALSKTKHHTCGRPDTLRREATKAIASMPPGHCLGALQLLQWKFTISSYGAFYQVENRTKEKTALVSNPFKNEEEIFRRNVSV